MYGTTSTQRDQARYSVTATFTASAPSSGTFRAEAERALAGVVRQYQANGATVTVGEVTEAERVLTLTQSELDALVEAECVRRATVTDSNTPASA